LPGFRVQNTKVKELKDPLEYSLIQAGKIQLHIVQAGPKSGLPVILLHGFPEFWYGWKKQISLLAEAGMRVIVPDQRGYNLSEKPKGINAYRLDLLAKDVVNLMDSLGIQKVNLCGHDWGGVVAWAVAVLYPERIERLAVLDAPYPPAIMHNLISHPGQILKSSYILYFQLPMIPEILLKRHQWNGLVESMRKTSRPGTFTPEDFTLYRTAWQQAGAMTSMLNWYRAFIQSSTILTNSMRITQPTLLLWGRKDFALGVDLAVASIKYCDQGKLEIFDQSGHWIQHEEPERVYKHLTIHFEV
jgi:pimeloyl-ACP methyl ester carboxylesterase